MKVMGKGAVKLTLHGVGCTISNVYWGPELKNNLLSVGQLQEKGVAVLFKDGVCSIYHPQKRKNGRVNYECKSAVHFAC